MMEQKENEHLVFTNEMPSWKIKLSYVFAGIFLILGVIILYFSWDFTQFRDGWDIFAFILIGGLGFFFCILPFYLIKTMKRRLKIHTKEELRNDGYHFFYYDEFTKNQYHLNMPFENMEFVLISLGLFEISQSYVDADGDVVQWYIDICLRNGVENNVPWMDDFFLDIVVLLNGEIIEKDADELEEALSKGIIDQPLYDLAWIEVEAIKSLISAGNFNLIELSNSHKEILTHMLK